MFDLLQYPEYLGQFVEGQALADDSLFDYRDPCLSWLFRIFYADLAGINEF